MKSSLWSIVWCCPPVCLLRFLNSLYSITSSHLLSMQCKHWMLQMWHKTWLQLRMCKLVLNPGTEGLSLQCWELSLDDLCSRHKNVWFLWVIFVKNTWVGSPNSILLLNQAVSTSDTHTSHQQPWFILSRFLGSRDNSSHIASQRGDLRTQSASLTLFWVELQGMVILEPIWVMPRRTVLNTLKFVLTQAGKCRG